MRSQDVQRAVYGATMDPPGKFIMCTLLFHSTWETAVLPEEFTPSLSKLAAMTGYSKSTVAEWLAALETAGWIKRDQIKGRRTRYNLLIGAPEVVLPKRASRRPPKHPADGPPGGHLPPSADEADSSASAGPAGGPVRPADTTASPPGGIPPVRPADTGCPPGGPGTYEISPTERSTHGDVPRATPPPPHPATFGAPRRPARSPGPEGFRQPPDLHGGPEAGFGSRTATPDVGHATEGAGTPAVGAPEPPSDRCPRHRTADDPPNCWSCADARKRRRAWEQHQAAAAAAAASRAARSRAAALRAQINACANCDDNGHTAGGAPCLHDATVAARISRGMAAARAALAASELPSPGPVTVAGICKA